MVAVLLSAWLQPPAIAAKVTVTVVVAFNGGVGTVTEPVAPVFVIRFGPPKLYVTVADGVPVKVN